MKGRQLALPGFRYIFRTYITLRNGRRLYARQVGLKAFRIPVPE